MGGLEDEYTDISICVQLLTLCVLENLKSHVVAILCYLVIPGTFQVSTMDAHFPREDI